MGLFETLGINRDDYLKVTDEEIIEYLKKEYPKTNDKGITDLVNSLSFGNAGRFWARLKILKKIKNDGRR